MGKYVFTLFTDVVVNQNVQENYGGFVYQGGWKGIHHKDSSKHNNRYWNMRPWVGRRPWREVKGWLFLQTPDVIHQMTEERESVTLIDSPAEDQLVNRTHFRCSEVRLYLKYLSSSKNTILKDLHIIRLNTLFVDFWLEQTRWDWCNEYNSKFVITIPANCKQSEGTSLNDGIVASNSCG